MLNTTNILEERKKKISDKIWTFFKSPSNLIFFLIILVAIILRFYVFIKTLNQPLWWDEGEYASGALHWAIGAPSALAPVREVIAPFLWSLLYRIYPGEVLWKLSQMFISLGLVFATYYCGKELFDKKVGLVASFFMTFNSLILFYSGRLLTYIWSPFLMTLVFLFFYKGYFKNQPKYLYYSALTFSFGLLAYWSVFLAIPIILSFLFITEGFKFIKNKSLWKATIVGLIPLGIYFIISKIKTGTIYARLSEASDFAGYSSFNSPFIYLQNFSNLFSLGEIIFFVIGIFAIFELFLVLDLLIKGKSDNAQKGKLFVFLWFLWVLGFFSWIYAFNNAPYWETFTFPFFPAVAIIASLGFFKLNDILSKYFSKKLVLTILIISLIIVAGIEINIANQKINSRIDSFGEIALAGKWLKENSNSGDIIASKSQPQLTYSSQRVVVKYPTNESTFVQDLYDLNVTYFVLSYYDGTQEWHLQLPEKYPNVFIPVYAIPLYSNPTQAGAVIYKIEK